MSEWETMTYPDAMSNMYDVYFLLRSDSGDEQAFSSGIPIMKALFDGNILSARISSIEIPAYQRQTATIDFASNKIERPVDNIDTPGQSSFSIRGDSRLYYVTAFNELSGTGIGNFFGKDVISNIKAAAIIAQNNQEVMTAQEEWSKKKEEINQEIDKVVKKEHEEMISKVEQDLETSDDLSTSKKQLKSQLEELQETCEKNSDMDYYTEATALIDSWSQTPESYKENTIKTLANEDSSTRRELRKKYKTLKKEYEKEQKWWQTLKKTAEANIKKITEGLKEKLDEKSYKETIKESNKKRKKAIDGLEFKSTSFEYLVNAMSRNISIVASEIDDASDEEALNTFLKSRKHLDIIVKRTTPGNRFRTILSEKCDERFIFEDVKILGTSNAVQFKRESADVQEFTYNFIYKRFYKQDTYGTTGSWVGSQTKMFTNYVLNRLTGLFTGETTGSEYWKQLTGSVSNSLNIKNKVSQINNEIKKAWKP